jgi:hypothetical protein
MGGHELMDFIGRARLANNIESTRFENSHEA